MANDPVRIGLIGVGGIARHHINQLLPIEGVEIVALCDIKPEQIQKATERFPALAGAHVTEDYRELLRRPDVDAVEIATPHTLHVEQALDAIGAQKHVLLEKPMALSVEDCDRILAAAQAAGRRVFVGHELRFSPLWGQVKSLIDQGSIGRPLHVQIALFRRPYRQGAEGWRWDAERVGSWILEEPIHFFDLADWYLSGSGEPATVSAWANRLPDRAPCFLDNFTATVTYGDGAYAVITQTLAGYQHHLAAQVVGERGAMRVWWSGEMDRAEHPEYGLEVGNEEGVRRVPVPDVPGETLELRRQIEAVARAVREGAAPAVGGREGRRAVRICLAAEQAVRSGNTVFLGDDAAPAGGGNAG